MQSKNLRILTNNRIMPNWCSNLIEITGNEADIQTILEAKMSFNKLLPSQVFSIEDDPTRVKTITWRQRNWGTKWDIVDEEKNQLIDGNNVELCVSIEDCIKADILTAWSPPIAFFENLTSQMEDLQVTMRFWEPGSELVGEVVVYAGNTHLEKIIDEVEFIRNWFDSEYEIDEEEPEDE